MKISLCLIVKNEEKYLERCLKSLYEYVDEIIVTDTWSSDSTVQIAKKYTDNIYHFEWINDFSTARNYCQSHATWDYILWMDADEWFVNTDIIALKEAIKVHPETDIFSINIVHLDAEYWKPIKKEPKIKIIKNNDKYIWKWMIHEIIDIKDPKLEYLEENFLYDINFYHTMFINDKLWTDINYFEKHFQIEPQNNTVALSLLEYYLDKHMTLHIAKIITDIPYIHWKLVWHYVIFWKKLIEAWLLKEKKLLDILIKKSMLSYKKLWSIPNDAD